MRLLAQPKVLARAAIAALLTTAACYPRLASWPARNGSLLFFCLVLLWATFVLWAFVWAWHFEYSRRPVLPFPRKPKPWIVATAYGLAAAILLRLFVDPRLRVTSPADFPTNLPSWVAMSLFTIAFDPLFIYFAPFAFFIRLLRRQNTAVVLTVLFGVFVQFLKLHSAPNHPSAWITVEQVAGPVAAGFLSMYLYLEGGAVLVWWPLLLMQLRHLPGLI